VPTGIALSHGASHAALTILGFGAAPRTNAYRSTDGGLTYVDVPLPGPPTSPAFILNGVGFVNDRVALLLGDSSTIIRMDASTGALTPLGAAAGIPQTTVDPVTQATTTYTFTRASFVPGTQTGWVVGSSVRRQQGVSNVVTGVILMSTDGGNTFVRQAIQGADDSGQAFPPVGDIFALQTDFAVLSGLQGLAAARTAASQVAPAVCSFDVP
jgi:hypothetical protein